MGRGFLGLGILRQDPLGLVCFRLDGSFGLVVNGSLSHRLGLSLFGRVILTHLLSFSFVLLLIGVVNFGVDLVVFLGDLLIFAILLLVG